MNMREIEAVSYSREGLVHYVKSPIIWGHKGTTLFPLCYLHKAKSVTPEEWNQFVDGFSFVLKKHNKED